MERAQHLELENSFVNYVTLYKSSVLCTLICKMSVIQIININKKFGIFHELKMVLLIGSWVSKLDWPKQILLYPILELYNVSMCDSLCAIENFCFFRVTFFEFFPA